MCSSISTINHSLLITVSICWLCLSGCAPHPPAHPAPFGGAEARGGGNRASDHRRGTTKGGTSAQGTLWKRTLPPGRNRIMNSVGARLKWVSSTGVALSSGLCFHECVGRSCPTHLLPFRRPSWTSRPALTIVGRRRSLCHLSCGTSPGARARCAS